MGRKDLVVDLEVVLEVDLEGLYLVPVLVLVLDCGPLDQETQVPVLQVKYCQGLLAFIISITAMFIVMRDMDKIVDVVFALNLWHIPEKKHFLFTGTSQNKSV